MVHIGSKWSKMFLLKLFHSGPSKTELDQNCIEPRQIKLEMFHFSGPDIFDVSIIEIQIDLLMVQHGPKWSKVV